MLRLEHSLHIDPERSLDRWLAAHHTLGLVVSDYYDNAHFVVTLGLLGWLWWARADIYRPLRNTLVLVNVLGVRRLLAVPGRAAADAAAASPTWSPPRTRSAPGTHGALASHANELAAMPSLHIAWAAWCTLAVWQARAARWVRALALAVPVR